MTTVPAPAKPLVYGYVRMEEPDEIQIAVLCKDIGTFCALHGYGLGTVFIDRGVPEEVFARTGFTALLDALRLPGAQAVVVPDLEHLSSQAFVQDALTRMVTAVGSQVLVAYRVTGPKPERELDTDPGADS